VSAEEFMGLPVHFSPLVPHGHVIFMGEHDGVVFSIPSKPRRRWWQRQSTVDARHAQAVVKSKRTIYGLVKEVEEETLGSWGEGPGR
jgi:hypothetical protein